jgi:hypothetical protein
MKDYFCKPSGKYTAAMLISLLFYTVALVLSLLWLEAGVTGPWKYVVALLPVLPALGIPVAVVAYCRTMDELQLRKQLEAVAFAFVSTAIVTFAYGFLQNAGLPDISWVWVWPVMAVCWMVGQLAARRRYH